MFLIPDTGFQVTLSKTRQVCEFSKMSVGKVTVVVLLEKEGLTLLRRWQCLNWWITKVTRTWRWLWILDIFLQGKGISYHMLWRWYSIQRNYTYNFLLILETWLGKSCKFHILNLNVGIRESTPSPSICLYYGTIVKWKDQQSINLDTWLSVKSQFKLRECPWALWGLILCIILTGLRHAQIAGETLTLDVSMGVFLEEIIILISRLNKKDSLPQCGWASFKPLRAWIKQKGRGRVN